MISKKVVRVDEEVGIVLISISNSTVWKFISEGYESTVKENIRYFESKLDLENRLIEAVNCNSILKDSASESAGLGLFVNKRIPKNSIIITEKPLLKADQEIINLYTKYSRNIYLKILSTIPRENRDEVANYFLPCSHMAPILRFPKCNFSTQQQILSLSCPKENLSLVILGALFQLAEILKLWKPFNLIDLSVETIVDLAVICAANVFGNEREGWIALFEKGCRINHSCLPNLEWKFNGTFLQFITLKDIKSTEELTQSYFDRERWQPTHIRKLALWTSRHFDCGCDLCQQPSDDKRRFRCPSCGSLDSILMPVVMSEHKIAAFAKSLPVPSFPSVYCRSCAAVLSAEETLHLLSIEGDWEAVVLQLSKLADTSTGIDPNAVSVQDSCLPTVLSVWEQQLQFAPLHWTCLDTADFIQSMLRYASTSPKTSYDMINVFPKDMMTESVLSKVIALQYRRLQIAVICYPRQSPVTSGIAYDLLLLILEYYKNNTNGEQKDGKSLDWSQSLFTVLEDRKFVFNTINWLDKNTDNTSTTGSSYDVSHSKHIYCSNSSSNKYLIDLVCVIVGYSCCQVFENRFCN